MKGLLGKKSGMVSWFLDDGRRVAATVLEMGPCTVTQLKSPKIDGYTAVQVGFEPRKEKHTTKPMQGHFKKAGADNQHYVHEFRLDDSEDVPAVGDVMTVDVLDVNLPVAVSGTSKGRGFAGVMKRHNFSGAQMTHGQSDRQRSPGSIGNASYPGRVFKGKRMPGRMGGERVTVKNLQILKIDADRNLLLVKGPVPGPNRGLVEVIQQD
jgi:large subunit ribosomal protein L3